MNTEKTINIDDKNIFVNPFQKYSPVEKSFALYAHFLACKPNHKILKNIGDNEITSGEHEGFGVTRSELLRRLACKYGYRTKPTFVYRNILANSEGIIINQVNCKGGSIGDDLSEKICSKYPIVAESYNKFLIKIPGSIQLIKVNDSATLWICNLFTPKYENRPIEWIFNLFGKAKAVNQNNEIYLKKGLVKLRTQIKKNHLQDLPVYIPDKMGKYQGWNWEETRSTILNIFPDAVICKN